MIKSMGFIMKSVKIVFNNCLSLSNIWKLKYIIDVLIFLSRQLTLISKFVYQNLMKY